MPKRLSISIAVAVLALAATVSAQDYQVVSIQNGGTISGTVKWAGPIPHLTPVVINKDALICDPSSQKTRDLERLILGPQAGIADEILQVEMVDLGGKLGRKPAGVELGNRPHAAAPFQLGFI